MNQKTWTDTDKAMWTLKHGYPDFCWIYERVDQTVYQRPVMADPTQPIPPWINKERTVVKQYKEHAHTEDKI